MTAFASVEGFRAHRIGEQRNAGISTGHHIAGTIYTTTDAVGGRSAQTATAFHPLLSTEAASLPCSLGKRA